MHVNEFILNIVSNPNNLLNEIEPSDSKNIDLDEKNGPDLSLHLSKKNIRFIPQLPLCCCFDHHHLLPYSFREILSIMSRIFTILSLAISLLLLVSPVVRAIDVHYCGACF